MIELILFLLSIPVGFLIAWMARDELVKGRRWFRILIIASVVGVSWFWLLGMREISWTFGFILVISMIALVKSQDKKWTKGAK